MDITQLQGKKYETALPLIVMHLICDSYIFNVRSLYSLYFMINIYVSMNFLVYIIYLKKKNFLVYIFLFFYIIYFVLNTYIHTESKT